MLKAGHIILCLLLLQAVVLEVHESQRPSPSSGQQNSPPPAQAQSNQPQSDKATGTEQSPFFVRTEKSKEETAENEQDRKDKAFNDHSSLFLSFAVAIGTLLQFGALTVIILTTRNQLRAYVMIESVALVGVVSGQKPDVKIVIKNSGQTPARHVTHWAKLGFTTFPEMSGPIPRRDPNEELPESAMAPSGTVELITGINIALNPATMNGLMAQTHALYVIGEIRYVDAFGKPRETDFMMFSTGHLIPLGSMASYKRGNRIT